MRRVVQSLLLATWMVVPVVPLAGAVDMPDRSTAVKVMFVKPLVLRGTLGDALIQATIRTKEEYEDGVEGEYFLFGHSQRILLAGEIEGDELLLEESENGTDVSGQWAGRLTGDVISGEWQSADGTVTKPFTLNVPGSATKEKSSTGTNGRVATRQ